MGRTVSGGPESSSRATVGRRPGLVLDTRPGAVLDAPIPLRSMSSGPSVPGPEPRSFPEPLSVPEPPSGTVTCALPPDLSAVREARNVVQHALGTWRAEEISDDVVLVASELVANALRHGMQVEKPGSRFTARPPVGLSRRSPIDLALDPMDDDGVRISLVSTGSHVICAVTDPSELPPVRRDADPLSGSGRGLHLVESLSLCWGWTVLDGSAPPGNAAAPQGKSVWAIFPLDLTSRRREVVGAA